MLRHYNGWGTRAAWCAVTADAGRGKGAMDMEAKPMGLASGRNEWLVADDAVETALAGVDCGFQAGELAASVGGFIALRGGLEQLFVAGDGLLAGSLSAVVI